MNLVIVESPNKVKTLQGILRELDGTWEVVASSGHIRDLPRNELGVDTRDFSLHYEYIPGQKKGGRTFPGGKDRVKRIASKIGEGCTVYLATDLDREGEAIAWHLKEALNLRPGQYRRIAFDSLDRATVEKALAEARDIDLNRVRAQEARRALDRLVGYTVSPLISRALCQKLSAGRVQSPALRYVVDRERAIRNFRVTSHFGAVLFFDGKAWRAEWFTKPYLKEGDVYILDRPLAEMAAGVRDVVVVDTKHGTQLENPPPPFTTSTLIQAASVALKFSPEQTARLAQKLFEAGHISYHRTDKPNLADETVAKLRTFAQQAGLPLPDKPRTFKSKTGSQEAHEAIRPKAFEARDIAGSDEERALYRLIWNRTVACQLAPARYKVNLLLLEGENGGKTFLFKAKGKDLIEAGWRGLTKKAAEHDAEVSGKDRADDEACGNVPRLKPGARLTAEDGHVQEKKTQPPKRFTKATLVKKLDEEGVGRPSTYPAIMVNIERRGYVQEKKRLLYPTELGEKLIDGLVENGFSFVDPTFTREMESELDAIAVQQAPYQKVMQAHYARLDQEAQALGGIESAQKTPKAPEIPTNEHGKPYPCPECGAPLRRIQRKDGGHFWGCTDYRNGCKGSMDDDNGKPVPSRGWAAKEAQEAQEQGFFPGSGATGTG